MTQLDLFTKTDREDLFEEITNTDQLKEAFKKVKENKGSPGIDRQTIEEFGSNIEKELKQLSEEVKNWTYEPKPVKRIEIPKPGGKGVRKLGIPCVRDRILQQSIKMSIEDLFEEKFSDSSYGFRPYRNQEQAIKKAQGYVKEGGIWIVDMDLEKFFDKIPQDRLMSKLSQTIKDKRVLRLIGNTLRSGTAMPDGLIETTEEGVVQGSPLSPLLSNIVLDELDKELEKRGLSFCRFADDCNVFCRSEKAAKRVMSSLTNFIEKKMKLKVNKEKSKVAKSDKVKFLGMTIHQGIIMISKKAIEKALEKIKSLVPRNSHQTIEQVIDKVNEWFRGWFEYFKMTEMPSQFVKIEAHVRRRIRAKIVAQQKSKKNLVNLLTKKGIDKAKANRSVYSKGRRTWALSHTSAVERAFSNGCFEAMGLLTFSHRKLPHWRNLSEWIKLA